jgi:DNA-binding CsgD family transcriptional regulator
MNINNHAFHPCLKHHDAYTQVSSPLEKLGVKFFGYTAVDALNRAYCLGSEANYASQYLQREHVAKDIQYFDDEASQKPSYLFWDYANLTNDEKKVYRLAHEHKQGHTLTITKHTKLMTHCYHFSGHIDDENINQRFLEEMDFLHSFIDYFDHCLTHIPEISSIYKHPINVLDKTSKHDVILINNDPRALDLDEATSSIRFKNFSSYYLTEKERACLYWMQFGKSFPMIAEIMDLSVKSIERHVSSIKRKYECYSLYQLGQKVAATGMNDLLEKSFYVKQTGSSLN